ncbi:hypothetical protein [Lysobacter arvi]|uniref:Stress-induced protein n=1 Tax=Lysobacter arvi TaxID=3038776 RepID=A0ABU1CG69_9GAMM|nr:hypothetical protein [Lysobacter arvi]MDR0183951.1 hypothetical protein [Lysobacter arvi]
MGTNKHAQDRVKSGHSTPPSGGNRDTDRDHAMRAGHDGPSQRKHAVHKEPSTRDEGRDDHRTGSDKRHH